VQDKQDIREHMKVIGSDGMPIGKVDHVEGDQIKLTRTDSADGQHHYVPLSSVASIEEDHVVLSMSGEDARRAAGDAAD